MNPPLVTHHRVEIVRDDIPLPPRLAGALVELSVRQTLAAPAALEATFADPQADTLDGWQLGNRLRAGIAGEAAPLFDGTVTGLDYDCDSTRGSLVRVIARDRLHVLDQRQTIRALEVTSAEDIARALAADLGCAFRSVEAAPQRALVIQHEQTDLDLLCDLAADGGLYPVLRGDTLLLVPLGGDGEPPVPLTPGRNLLSARVSRTSDRSLAESRAQGIDLALVTAHEGSASLARQDHEEMRDPGLQPLTARRHLLNRLADHAGEAEALAQAAMDRAAAREAVAEGVAEGDPALTPGRLIALSGIADALGGRYAISRAVHRFTAEAGYVTEFSTAPPQRPSRTRAASVLIGQVTHVDDPERLGRCRVALPALGALETGWMQVMVAGAGASRGVAALPHTGDDVLVLCPDGDPARGIILGSLYGTRKLPRNAGGPSPRGVMVRSGDGQALELSGKGGTARLLNNGGSLVELTPEQMRLAAACDLLIEAPGRTLTIRAADIFFERG